MPVRGRDLCFHIQKKKKRILWLFPSELGFHCTNCKSRSLRGEKVYLWQEVVLNGNSSGRNSLASSDPQK